MPTSTEWPVFFAAVIVYAVAPGPALVYVLVRSLHGGRREGACSALGNSIGTAAHVVATAIGLSAVVASSPMTYTVVKLGGALYLGYLGVQVWRAAPSPDSAYGVPLQHSGAGGRSSLLQGAIVEGLNPSTAMFFLALFPQFVHPDRADPRATIVVLGMVVVITALLVDLTVVLAASRLRRKLDARTRRRRGERFVVATVFVSLGGFVGLR